MRSSQLAFACLALPAAFAFAAVAASAAEPKPSAEPKPTGEPKPAVELVAHRGESYDAPENTLDAYKLAWDRGVPAAELDVHLTKDGKLILSHDADTKRTAGTKLVVKEHTADELRKLDVGAWKHPKFAGERMPLLDEVLPAVPAGRRMFIEVKVGPEAIPELARCVERSGKSPEQLPIISFNLDTCREAKKALPKHKVYFLSSFKQDKQTKKWGPTVEELIAKAKEANLDGLDVQSKEPTVVDAAFAKAVRDAKLALLVWTVDDPALAKKMVDLGVDGITTNRGQWMAEQLAGK